MNYKITNLEYGTGPWGTEMFYGGIGNPVDMVAAGKHDVVLAGGVDIAQSRPIANNPACLCATALRASDPKGLLAGKQHLP